MFAWGKLLRHKFHTGITFWFRIVFTWWWVISYLAYLKVHFMMIKYTCNSRSHTLRMRYLSQSTCRPISLPNGWSFRVYMIPVWNFIPCEILALAGTTTGVNSHQGDSRQHDILWWYHVNKCRATRGSQSELTPPWKLPWCHVNTP